MKTSWSMNNIKLQIYYYYVQICKHINNYLKSEQNELFYL